MQTESELSFALISHLYQFACRRADHYLAVMSANPPLSTDSLDASVQAAYWDRAQRHVRAHCVAMFGKQPATASHVYTRGKTTIQNVMDAEQLLGALVAFRNYKTWFDSLGE